MEMHEDKGEKEVEEEKGENAAKRVGELVRSESEKLRGEIFKKMVGRESQMRKEILEKILTSFETEKETYIKIMMLMYEMVETEKKRWELLAKIIDKMSR